MINGRLSDDFIALTTKLMMAQERNEIIHLAAEFNSTIERLIEAKKRAPNAVNKMLPKYQTKMQYEKRSKPYYRTINFTIYERRFIHAVKSAA